MAAKTVRSAKKESDDTVRDRILRAAMEAFMHQGFAAATMLEIATRAKVSKRELYALVGNKEEMLAACVAGRGQRMRLPEGFPAPVDAASFRTALRVYGTTLLGELMDPGVLGVFRLGVAESLRSPAVAASIEEQGRKPARAALEALLRSARAAKLLRDGDLTPMVAHYQGLLWGDLMVWVLLGTVKAPNAKEIKHRAEEAADMFIALFGRA
jgi:AcrR family transcriptional regulator